MSRTTAPFRLALGAIPALTLATALTLTGCGAATDEDDATPTPTAEETASAAVDEAPAEQDDAEQDNDAEVDAPASNDALQDYVDLELSQLDAMGDSLGDLYSDISVEAVPPNGIEYSYTYADQVDASFAEESLAGIEETLQQLLDTAVFPMMVQAGVEEPLSATYTYLNADGTELWSETFTSE